MNSVMKAWGDLPPIYADRLMALLSEPARLYRGLHRTNALLLDADRTCHPHWLRPLRWAILYHDAVPAPQAPGRDGIQAPGRDGIQAPGRDGIQAPGRDGIQAPGRDGIQAPGRDGIQAPGRDGIQAPGRDGIQAPGRDGIQAPGRDGIQAPGRDGIHASGEGTGRDAARGSMELWLEHFPAIHDTVHGVSGGWEQEIAAVILLTAEPFERPAGLLPWQLAFLDLVCGDLGAVPAVYAAHRLLALAEATQAGLAPADWVAARRESLARALACDRLYHLVHRDREAAARQNMQDELGMP